MFSVLAVLLKLVDHGEVFCQNQDYAATYNLEKTGGGETWTVKNVF